MQLSRFPLTILLLALWIGVDAPGARAAESAAAPAPLFLNVTTVDPHAAHMALSVAEMSAQAGHPVTIFLNLDAVRLAARDADMFAAGRADLERALKAGARLLVCRHCLAYAGLAEAALIEQAELSTPERVTGALFAPGGRTLSY